MHEFDGYDKMIHGWIQEAVAENQPRQATVVRSDGAHVFVRFIGEGPDAPEAKLPSSIADLTAGTVGWVYPVAGGKELFVAAGISVPSGPSEIPSAEITAGSSATARAISGRRAQEIVNKAREGLYTKAEVDALIPIPFSGRVAAMGIEITTSTSVFTYLAAATVTLAAGTYAWNAMMVTPVRRSVQSGEVHTVMRVGGSESDVMVLGMGGTPPNQFFTIPHAWAGTVTVPGGPVTIDIGFRGGVTAGTTGMYRATITGTLTRIS